MKVVSLELDGFKSYAEKTVINDWDKYFNCVTGQNGSGKSNIMDALTFVLGLSALKEVRAKSLLDLIYKYGKKNRMCSVSITFDNTDKDASPAGFENDSRIIVTRQIHLTRTNQNKGDKPESSYRVNGHRADRDTVKKLFRSVQLNIDNPNFLVRQGQAMHVIEETPKAILQKVEEAAGTYGFFQQAMASEKELLQCESDIAAYNIQLSENIRPKLRKKEESLVKYREIKAQFDQLKLAERLVPAMQYMQYVQQSEALDDQISQHAELQSANNDVISSSSEQLQNCRESLRALRDASRDANIQTELDSRHSSLVGQLANAEAALRTTETSLFEMDVEKQQCHREVEAAKAQLTSLSGEKQQFISEYESKRNNLARIRTDLESTGDLLAGLETGISTSGARDSGYALQMRAIRDAISSITTKIKRGQERKQICSSSISQSDYNSSMAKLQVLKEQGSSLEVEIQAKSEEVQALKSNNNSQDLQSRFRVLKSELARVEQALNVLRRRDSRLDFQAPGFSKDQIQGLVGHLFSLKPEFSDKADALEVCAGGSLFNVVVKSDEIGTRLLNSGLRRRVTLLPLNKIRARMLEASKVSNAKKLAPSPNEVDLAIDTIDFDNSVESAMKYVFGSTLIANNAKIATAVTYNPSVAARTITLQGDTYDPQGTLSGGAASNSSGILKLFQEYNTLSAKQAILLKDLESAALEMEKSQAQQSGVEKLERELDSLKFDLNSIRRKLTEGPDALLVESFKQNQDELKVLESNLTEWNDELIVQQEKLELAQKDSAEFDKDRDGKLGKIRAEIAELKQQEAQLSKVVSSGREQYNSIKGGRDGLESSIEIAMTRINELESAISDGQKTLQDQKFALTTLQQELKQVSSGVAAEAAAREEQLNSITALEERISCFEADLDSAKMSNQIAEQEIATLTGKRETIRTAVNKLKQEFEFIGRDSNRFGVVGDDYDYNSVTPGKLAELRQVLEKRQIIRGRWNTFSKSLSEEVSRALNQERDISRKVMRLEQDKVKILTTVKELDGKRHEEVSRVYKEISREMGEIFGTMLSGCSCKLEPIDPNDVMAGLRIAARIGPTWKESINELSGGQKSLVGLCFLFAMLRYRPAPFYILDEVDAALDLQHTQNLGKVFKNTFPTAQFIVVSLKDNMFANANRLFRVTNVGGVSHVTTVGEDKTKKRKRRDMD